MKICKKCLMMETRPRLTFDENGVCAACNWAEEKKTKIDWNARQNELHKLADKIRGKYKYDCLVPVSGGKDSSYVAYKLKHDFNLNILTVTITPPMESDLIKHNLQNFINAGYENIKISPNPKIIQKINKFGFVEQGRPQLGWIMSMVSAVPRLASIMQVPLIMYGEEGESEYGGSTRLRYTPFYNAKDTIEIYLEGNAPQDFAPEFKPNEFLWWTFPTEKELEDFHIDIGHWSYFENWNSYKNYEVAKDKCGLMPKENRSVGTYNNFAQVDTVNYDLHTYMMYLKFGFGRCLQDVCIDIRLGKLTRDEGIEMVKKYDGEFIERYIPNYLNYYEMTRAEFDAVLDRHANKNLFEKKNGIWTRKFEIK